MNTATPFDDGGPAFPVSDPQSSHATAMAASLHIEDPTERERAYILARAAAVIGMSMRDYFAKGAMEATLASETAMEQVGNQATKKITPFAIVARMAYRMADEMLKARSA